MPCKRKRNRTCYAPCIKNIEIHTMDNAGMHNNRRHNSTYDEVSEFWRVNQISNTENTRMFSSSKSHSTPKNRMLRHDPPSSRKKIGSFSNRLMSGGIPKVACRHSFVAIYAFVTRYISHHIVLQLLICYLLH